MKIPSSRKKQRGVASIIFVLTFPLLFSVFVLAVESTRYLQTHARINDAVEMASLAVAASASQTTRENQLLAKRFVESFVPDGDIDPSDIRIERKSCDDIYQDLCGQAGVYDRDGLIFTQYKVTLTSDFDSWFPKDGYHLGYAETMTLGGDATARKYQGFTIDVAFVADFSGSMEWVWQGNQSEDNGEFSGITSKYQGVVEVIKRVTERLEDYNASTDQQLSGQDLANRAAFVGYNFYPHKNGSYYSNVSYHNNTGSKSWRWDYNIPQINFNATARDPLGTPVTTIIGRSSADSSYFNTLPLTEDFQTFRAQISQFVPNYGTASYEGIIEAAKIVSRGENVRKLIVVLSDGIDSANGNNSGDRRYPNYAATQLYDRGLCQNIIQSLEQQVVNGRNAEARIFVIGFDYNLDDNPGLKTCAGEENVQAAQSYQDIYDTVLELISEEVGRLYFGS
ncbi:TadE/TadG family type IV pilus assembly protein [Enterovibrio paralichthyis]|uniref:TadE/TadG family type IV pilus assembly protein n=1 Tax=Enterovibrio paralichthyis TaxID=2853805 RepID=UPI0006CFAB64|nr:TadE/TadG family type IV pilus assembly protein [Enterovibrio paralichthyis]MBV7296470.1 pilus assembly protein [Enterovibrio paralichthyis]